MNIKKTPRGSKGLTAGVIAAVGLVLLVFLIYKVVTSALPASSQAPGKFNTLLKTRFAAVQFSARAQDSLRPLLAGFWEFKHDTTLGTAKVSRLDRLEIKPNGYIWQVDKLECTPATGAPLTVFSIANYFLSPFGKVDKSTSELLCELAILRHVYIVGNDTCYTAGVAESTWVMQRTAAGLFVEGNQYAPFDTAGHIHQFFPAGALKLVDKINLNQCPASLNPLAKIQALAGAGQ